MLYSLCCHFCFLPRWHWYTSGVHLFNNLSAHLNLRSSSQWTPLFVLGGVDPLPPELRAFLRHLWSIRRRKKWTREQYTSGEISILKIKENARRAEAGVLKDSGCREKQQKGVRVPRFLAAALILLILWCQLILSNYSGDVVTDINRHSSHGFLCLKSY